MWKEIFKKIIPQVFINWYHFLLVLLGAIFYQFPGKKMIIIGVTGTNGKSTVVELIGKILEEANFSVASLSSIQFKIAGKEQPNLLKMTMPGRFQLQKFLRKAFDSGCRYGVIEVTSEGIAQYRHRFINFQAAVFTNLTPEHIEAHGSFEKYKTEKGKLFQTAKGTHIINLDDENTDYFQQFLAKEKYGYGIDFKLEIRNWKFIKAADVNISSKGIDFSIKDTQFHLNLLGGFNVSNALAAICVGLSQGISLETCKSALEKLKEIPGRMEEVVSEPFQVFVDYAFTPNALEKVYQILKPKIQNTNSKLLCVLGAAGGGRDKWKRPVLGEIAATHCQEIIITNEDPYDENPYQILSEIESGISKSKFPISNFYEILDRREAINKALSLSKPNDVVIITGKGCEPWICVERGKKIPWDDRKIVREEFEKLNIK